MSDNAESKKDVVSLEKAIPEEETEGIAMELLREFKENNKRMDEHNKRLIGTIKWLMVLVGLVVGGFLLYLYQYDFSGTIEQSGVYTLIDSNGNVISSDITPEQMEDILKIINGKNENNKKEN